MKLRLLSLALLLLIAPARAADAPPQNDLLNAVLWLQRSVEFKANATATFALARLRLDEALADPRWTAAPAEQTGDYAALPPAVVLDVDETVLSNMGYEAWATLNDQAYDPKVWTKFVSSKTSTAIPGALDFTRYADGKGVKVFYVTNRNAAEEAPTREAMAALGFPMGGNVDTFLMAREKPEWGSEKGSRRAFVAKNYRILLNIGDNFGDFVDGSRSSEAERLKLFDANRERWGREWIMIANPSYGSFETAPFGHDLKQPPDVQRKAKRDALQPWAGP